MNAVRAAGLAAALRVPRFLGALTTGADFLDANIPARPAALAGSFAAYSDDPVAFLYNPAALGRQSQPMLSATHFLSIVDTEFDQASYVEPLTVWGSEAGLGMDVQYDTTGNFQQIDAQGNALGSVANYDLLAEGAGGIAITDRLRLGAAAKIFDSLLAQYHAQGYAADLGAQYDLAPGFTLGAALMNMGSESAFISVADALPARLSLAARYVVVDEGLNLLQASAEVDRFFSQADPTAAGFGAEYWYARTLVFRLGWLDAALAGPMSIGMGVRWGSLELDYTYSSLGDLGMMNRFSLTVALGSLFEKLGWTVAPIRGVRTGSAAPEVRVAAP